MFRCLRSCWCYLSLLVAVSLVGCSGSSSDELQPEVAFESATDGATSEVRIEKLETGLEVFEWLSAEVHAFKYSNGAVKFWLELEKDGEKQKLFGDWFDKMTHDGEKVTEGGFVWVREQIMDDPSKETWRIGYKVVRDSASQFPESRSSGSVVVQLWDKSVPAVKSAYRSQQGGGHVPSTLPLDREFPLYTITGSMNEEGGGEHEEYVIRVMCKAVTQKDQADKSENPAN